MTPPDSIAEYEAMERDAKRWNSLVKSHKAGDVQVQCCGLIVSDLTDIVDDQS